MLRKVLTLIAVVVVAMLAVVPVVSAQEPRGEGSLTAQGDGIAILRGRGTVDLSGNGTLSSTQASMAQPTWKGRGSGSS